MQNQFPIVILCGGKSSRMKEDKALLPFGEYNSLIEFQYNKYKKNFQNLFISSKKNKFDFLDEKSNSIIYDYNTEVSSPLIALKTILEKLQSQKVMIVPVDTPFISEKTIHMLIHESNDCDITIAKTKSRTHNLCGVFSQSILMILNQMIDANIHKVGYLLNQVKTKEILFENEEEFLNLNTPIDYEKALNVSKHLKRNVR